ncbi:hypothetical protein CLV63_12733 [Murinocardiopsis flavida]|uniref:VWFA domain-containing protein n=1 Tax=Murinocardiopsis flavida TaxID=645275 RepID=A0A2P8CW36_9ACTN|nr:vWA domain-containing protein [Murinocardiopsis flavida]PSK89160.1 hypothetical protein CLV63_12733 [Murinocardiopsis flavida]
MTPDAGTEGPPDPGEGARGSRWSSFLRWLSFTTLLHTMLVNLLVLVAVWAFTETGVIAQSVWPGPQIRHLLRDYFPVLLIAAVGGIWVVSLGAVYVTVRHGNAPQAVRALFKIDADPSKRGVAREAERLKGSRRGRVFVSGAVVFVTLSLLLSGSVVALNRPFGDCAPPADLIALTTPDNEPTLERRARGFAQARTGADGCRQVHVTVFSVDTPQQDLRRGIGAGGARAVRDWAIRHGALPHIWVPDTGADWWIAQNAAERDTRADGAEPTALRLGGSTDEDELVLAVPPGQARAMRKSDHADDRHPFDLLRDVASPAEVPVVRANPELSGAALLHMLELYLDDGLIRQGGQAEPPRAVAADIEAELGGDFVQAGSERDLLCRAAATGRAKDGEIAVLTTRRALRSLPTASDVPPECARNRGRLRELQEFGVEGASVLTYPFVEIDRGAAGAEAGELAAFRSFLTGDGGGGGSVERVGDFAEQLMQTRLAYGASSGESEVLLALDRSTSMGMERDKYEAALAEVGAFTSAAEVNRRDRIGLWTFPAGPERDDTGVDPVAPLSAEGAARIRAAFGTSALKPRYEATPLREVISSGVRSLAEAGPGAGGGDGPEPVLVVITDGVGSLSRGAMRQSALERDLAAADGVAVRILAVGGRDLWNSGAPCEVPQIEAIVRGAGGVECVPVDAGAPGSAARALLDDARERRRR